VVQSLARQASEGVGALTAAGLVAELGQARRGRTEAQLAALAGVAPLEASPAGGVRHRLNRGGNRRLNRRLHVIARIQARVYPPAQASLARRQQAGRTAARPAGPSSGTSSAASGASGRPAGAAHRR
jgi:transposase